MELQDIKAVFCDGKKKFSITEANALVNIVYEKSVKINTTDRFHGRFFYEIMPLVAIATNWSNLST